MDAEEIIKEATEGRATLATGFLATLIRDQKGEIMFLSERLAKVETRLDAASKAFSELKKQITEP